MKGLFFFLLGSVFGGVFGVGVMCLLQISKYTKIDCNDEKNNLFRKR